MAQKSTSKKVGQIEIKGHSHKKTKAVVNRLSRIEGHVRSIKDMVASGRECTEVLIQIAAVRSAINKVGKVVLEDHLENCLFGDQDFQKDSEAWESIKDVFNAYF